jgi:hypothetical protein
VKSHQPKPSAMMWCLRIAAVCIPLLVVLGTAESQTVPGATGQIVPTVPPGNPPDGKGRTSYWSGTGWNNPGVAGCHWEVPKNKNAPRRVFGESCQNNVMLIEHTPGEVGGQPHPHENDVGKPILVNCTNWCRQTKKGNQGVCRTVNGPPPCNQSARCECN